MENSVDDVPQCGKDRAAQTQDAHTLQPCREQNISALTSFFESGIKQTSEELGIELEHIVLRNDDTAVPYDGKRGIQWVLEQLQAYYPETTYDDQGDLLAVSRPGEAITLEPAAQLELSAGPFCKLADAENCFVAFEELLEKILDKADAHTAILGYHPKAKASALTLIPKQRYECMDRAFRTIGPFGSYMMRASASTQISIDYRSEADCIRKLRLAYALAPLFALMSDNSPIFEGEARKHRMVRTEIWQKCDPARCGIVPGVMDDDFSFRRYAEFVLDVPAILAPDGKGGWLETQQSFGELYAEKPMERADVEHALSMVFPDVRLKTYVEIRPADALPISYVLAYAALIKGIFYNEAPLEHTEQLLAAVSAPDIEAAKNALMDAGYAATIYGKPVASIADELISIANKSLSPEERNYLLPLARLVEKRTTLADFKR